MRLPIVKSLHIEKIAGTGIEAADYYNKNAIVGEYSDGSIYASQRPSIDIWGDASDDVAKVKGRGVYYWEAVDDWYIVNDDSVYKTSYATGALGVTMTSGTAPVYFFEMTNYLVILDPENNEGWYIASGASTTLVQITDINFPGQASNAELLTTGGAYLDGRLYVGTTAGSIYGSDSNDPTSWDPLNKISAERENDSGVHLDKHFDHVVMLGSTTIEFFWNAANPTGSPLSRRKDIYYNLGCLQGNAVFREGDDLYFVAVQPSGPLKAVRMSQMQLTDISPPDVDSFITNARLVETSLLVGSGFTSGNRSYYCLTFYRLSAGLISPDITIVFDGVGWGVWETTVGGQTKFPLMSWNIRSGTGVRSGAGIFSNGDLLTISDDFSPIDTVLATSASSYIASGYIETGYYVSAGGTPATSVNIEFRVRTGPNDFDTSRWKFMHNLEVACDEATGTETATIKWVDGNSIEADLNTGRTIRLDRKEKITRLGRFKRRNMELTYSGTEQLRIEGFDVEVTEGGH